MYGHCDKRLRSFGGTWKIELERVPRKSKLMRNKYELDRKSFARAPDRCPGAKLKW